MIVPVKLVRANPQATLYKALQAGILPSTFSTCPLRYASFMWLLFVVLRLLLIRVYVLRFCVLLVDIR